MKFGELEDIRRRYERKSADPANRIRHISISGLSGFSDFELDIATPLLCVCGSTGIGKSTLMHLLHQAVGQENQAIFGSGIDRFSGASAKLVRDFQGNSQTLEFGQDLGSEVGAHDLIDVDRRTTLPQNFFRTEDFEALLQGYDPFSFDRNLLKIASFVANRTYDEISVREIEIDGDDILPLFSVKSGCLEYDSRTCSLGELSIFYIIWYLNIFRERSVVFVEEPEAFLPPTAQKSLLYTFWTSIIRREHCLVLSTHSPQIISEVPRDSLLPIRKMGETSRVLKDPHAKERVLSKLGLKSSSKYIIFVEDELAKLICSEMLSNFGLDKFCEFQILPHKDSSGGIKTFVSGLDRSIEGVYFSAILDGDMRDDVKNWKMLEDFEFLPFTHSMEHEFLEVIGSDVEKLSSELGRDVDRIEDSLDDGAGSDPHTRYAKLADDLGVSMQSLTIAAHALWAKRSENARAIRDFIESIRKRFGIS